MPSLTSRAHLVLEAREIENEDCTGRPLITVTRLLEENDVVVAEGTVRAERTNGEFIDLAYSDVFGMRHARVRKLTSYLMNVPAAAPDRNTPHSKKICRLENATPTNAHLRSR